MRRVMKTQCGSSVSNSVRWERRVSLWPPSASWSSTGSLPPPSPPAPPGRSRAPPAPRLPPEPRFLGPVEGRSALASERAASPPLLHCSAPPRGAAWSASELISSILDMHSLSSTTRLRCAQCARDAASADCSLVKLLTSCWSFAMRDSWFSISTKLPWGWSRSASSEASADCSIAAPPPCCGSSLMRPSSFNISTTPLCGCRRAASSRACFVSAAWSPRASSRRRPEPPEEPPWEL
mmetsp:Transcript_28131/g.75004  ORF Transcript_28131/g.75004 Transcript_28131/m.75004 type:complete len:237 (+) Transcript_28131:1083-1793(+)